MIMTEIYIVAERTWLGPSPSERDRRRRPRPAVPTHLCRRGQRAHAPDADGGRRPGRRAAPAQRWRGQDAQRAPKAPRPPRRVRRWGRAGGDPHWGRRGRSSRSLPARSLAKPGRSHPGNVVNGVKPPLNSFTGQVTF